MKKIIDKNSTHPPYQYASNLPMVVGDSYYFQTTRSDGYWIINGKKYTPSTTGRTYNGGMVILKFRPSQNFDSCALFSYSQSHFKLSVSETNVGKGDFTYIINPSLDPKAEPRYLERLTQLSTNTSPITKNSLQ